MKIAIPRERAAGENRVAATPDTIGKLVGMGLEVVCEKGAGKGSSIPDEAYAGAGATIAGDAAATMGKADIVLKVRAPVDAAEVGRINSGAVLIGLMTPHLSGAEIAACAKRNLTVFSMELLPRITRAQTMDVLSSQSNLAGYRTVIDAAAEFGRAFPMMMTAAGTVAPAKVFVMGAGVAGLQAIATARRLGAVVSATDVRAAAGEQVASLGAKFIMIELEGEAETAGGYARELTDDEKRRQAELVAGHIGSQDIVITTALIPGRPAPRLITRDMVASMKPGSVIVDLAVEAGGNVEGSKPDAVVEAGNVKIVGYTNFAGRVAVDASQLYARNLLNFLTPMIDTEAGTLQIDMEDEIVAATLLTRDGRIVNDAVAEPAAPKPAKARAAGTRKKAAGSPARGAKKDDDGKDA